MRVSGLDNNDDWRFGRGRASYISNSKAIAQNVKTRLRSFTDDWFLDVDAGVAWFELLGSRKNESRILRAIERTVLQTEGVLRIDKLELTLLDVNRRANISLSYTDVFGTQLAEFLEVP